MEIQWISTVPPIIAEKDAAIKRQASHRMPMGQAAFTALPCGRNPHTVTAGIPIAKVHPASSNLVNAEQRLIDKEAVLVVQDQREVGAGRRAFPREQHCGVMQRQRLAAHMFDGKIKGQDPLNDLDVGENNVQRHVKPPGRLGDHGLRGTPLHVVQPDNEFPGLEPDDGRVLGNQQ